MNKKLVLLGAAALLTVGTSFAQKRVTGRVVDTDGQPVAGATVRVEGEKQTVLTDANGNFSLSGVPASAKHLRVSYIGKVAETVSVAGNVKVVLKDLSQDLGEAYVVAYGRATKASFTGAAAKVKGEVIENKSTTEVTSALQGEVAGVQIINTDGNPGASSGILIRGIGSVNASASPLIVVDGMPYAGSFSSIDPKDIASIDIMKDATASALYGSRGANGVVIITTKKGQKGKLNIGADVKYSVSGRWLPNYDVIKSPERFLELSWEGIRNNYLYFQQAYKDANGNVVPYDEATAGAMANAQLFSESGINPMYNMWNADGDKLIDPATGRFYAGITRKYTPENWEDYLMRTGQKFDGSVNLSGGSDRAQFYTSLGFTKDKGYLIGADFRRFTARTNVDAQITNWLKGSVNLAYTNMRSNQSVQEADAENNAIKFSYNMPSIFPVFMRDADGNLIPDEVVGGMKYDYGMAYGRNYAPNINPAGVANLDMNRSDVDQLTGNGSLEASFLNDFKLTGNLGYTYYNSTNTVITNPYYGDAEGLGRLDKGFSTTREITGNQILSWKHTYGAVHNLSAFIGHEATWNKSEISSGSMNNLVRADDPTFGNAVKYQSLTGYDFGYSLDSYFGQVSYDYAEKYFVNANVRRDGSSRFAKGNRWGTFGAVSAAWNITKENFMKDLTWLHNLKLKASWGVTGNQSLSSTALGTNGSYYPYADIYTIRNVNDNPSFVFAFKGNKDLTWERTNNLNIGLEFDIAGVIEGEVDYFNKLTSDMLFLKKVSLSQGYSTIPVNDGKMRNSGVEFNVIAHVVNTPKVGFDIRLNGAHYKNEMVELPMDEVKGERVDYYANGGYYWTKGGSMYDFYMAKFMGVDPETGLSLFRSVTATLEDGSKEVITDMELFKSQHKGEKYTLTEGTTTDYNKEATFDFTGDKAIPVLTGGLGFDLRIQHFTLGATFTYALGGKAYDNNYAALMADGTIASMNWHKDIENRWQKPGDITDVPRLDNNSTDGRFASATSTRFLTSRSYLQLSNIRLAYNFPNTWTEALGGLNGVQLYANGENLFLLSARKGFMPGTSISGASSRTQYLPSSSFTVGLKFNF